jgi:hypothetical protein
MQVSGPVSPSGHFTSREGAISENCIENWMEPQESLDVIIRRKIPVSLPGIKTGSPVCKPSITYCDIVICMY